MKNDILKLLKRLDILFARLAQLLPGIDPRCGDGRNPHPVTDKQDDIAYLGVRVPKKKC